MDVAEGAFVIAERALLEARAARAAIGSIPSPERQPTSFFVNTPGDLVVIWSDGTKEVAGRVRGDDGHDATPPAELVDAAIDGDGQLIFRLSDNRSINAGRVRGDAGAPGKDAPVIPGPAGRSVTSARIDDRGRLVIAYSDGTTEDAGLSAIKGDAGDQGTPGDRGADGPAGCGISLVDLVDGFLHLELTDGRSVGVGRVVGANGETGRPGANGVGIAGATIDEGNLRLSLTDGQTIDAGRVVGQDGRAGRTGTRGPIGPPGAAAVPLEIGSVVPARLTASDLSRLYEVEVTVDGQVLRLLGMA